MLHAGSVPDTDLATWDFRVFGEVENPITLSWEEFNALPKTENVQDIHCVTRWSRFDARFGGVQWRELAKLVSPKPSARFVIAHSEQGYTANVPLEFLEDDNALLATEADGEPLTPEHGWPLRLVIPGKYFWKSAKWLRGSSSERPTSPGSGSATGTTTTPTPGAKSATASRTKTGGPKGRPFESRIQRLLYRSLATGHCQWQHDGS